MKTVTQRFSLRIATEDDILALHSLIEASVRGLHVDDYTPAQIEGALDTGLGVDTQLIRDRTFFIAEARSETAVAPIGLAGCGGWSNRRTLFGGDRASGREPGLLDAARDAARIRAIFVHRAYARQGLGSMILAHVEAEAVSAGFRRFEMGSTLTGVKLYRLRGYVEVERIDVPLANGEVVPVVKMVKSVE